MKVTIRTLFDMEALLISGLKKIEPSGTNAVHDEEIATNRPTDSTLGTFECTQADVLAAR